MTTPSTTLTQPGLVRADRGPFGLPKGLSGRLAGRLMAANDEQQRELSQLVEIPPKGSLCEVGFGPGVLLGLLRARFPDASLCGVDPSTVMLRQAARAIGDAAIDLRCAAAGDLPFEDDTFDVTVSFNTMQFWPDRNAGLREIRRVTRPGGKVLISWHGGTAPTRIQRRLVLATPSWLVSPLPSASTSATSANNTSPSLSSSPPSSEPAPDDRPGGLDGYVGNSGGLGDRRHQGSSEHPTHLDPRRPEAHRAMAARELEPCGDGLGRRRSRHDACRLRRPGRVHHTRLHPRRRGHQSPGKGPG